MISFLRNCLLTNCRFYWIKIKALVTAKEYTELEEFAKKKSPIGYAVCHFSTLYSLSNAPQPFVEECLAAHDSFQAKKYLMRVANLDQRARFFIQLKFGSYEFLLCCDFSYNSMFPEAIEVAVQMRSDELFEAINDRAGARKDVQQMLLDARSKLRK